MRSQRRFVLVTRDLRTRDQPPDRPRVRERSPSLSLSLSLSLSRSVTCIALSRCVSLADGAVCGVGVRGAFRGRAGGRVARARATLRGLRRTRRARAHAASSPREVSLDERKGRERPLVVVGESEGEGEGGSVTRSIASTQELGAGDGEWAAAQASVSGSKAACWVASEMRHDRAAAIAARAALGRVARLGVASGDGRQLLAALAPASLAHCFANFPEPPQQQRGGSSSSSSSSSANCDATCDDFFDGRHMRETAASANVAAGSFWKQRSLVSAI